MRDRTVGLKAQVLRNDETICECKLQWCGELRFGHMGTLADDVCIHCTACDTFCTCPSSAPLFLHDAAKLLSMAVSGGR